MENLSNRDLLDLSRRYWDSMYTVRQDAQRNRKFRMGDQWSDKVEVEIDGEKKQITEEQYIISNGRYPYVQNKIGQLVNNLLGRFRMSQGTPMVIARDRDESDAATMLSNALQANKRFNRCIGLEARNYETFAVWGLCITKTTFKYFPEVDRSDGFYQNINPHRFFFNTDCEDTRFKHGLNLIGEIHDLTMDEAKAAFPDEEDKLEGYYKNANRDAQVNDPAMSAKDNIDNIDFFVPVDATKVRIIEVWVKEPKVRYNVFDPVSGKSYVVADEQELEAENVRRMQVDPKTNLSWETTTENVWVAKWLTPYGDLIQEIEDPYLHQDHPYTFSAWPYLDQETQSFVKTLIPAQKQLNRNLSMADAIVGSSAKGLLVVDERVVADDQKGKIQQIWSAIGGVLKLKSQPNIKDPYQISNNANIAPVLTMAETSMSLMDNISGTGQALQGQAPSSGTAASLYRQEAEYSSINSKDFEASFLEHRQESDKKMSKIIQQFYDEPRYIEIEGDISDDGGITYDPEKVKNFDYDFVIKETPSIMVQQLAEENLEKLFAAGQITLPEYLANSQQPYSNKLLQMVKSREQGGEQPQAQAQFELEKEKVSGGGQSPII